MKPFSRFKFFDTWDEVVECGEDVTAEESAAICDGGFYGKKVNAKTIALLNAGKSYADGAGGSFVFTGRACDGAWEKKFKTKEALIEYAKGYTGYRQGSAAWVDDDGRTFEVEGVTYDEIFPNNKED